MNHSCPRGLIKPMKLSHEEVRRIALLARMGLSEEETAAILGLSTRTVEREWRFAKSWLKREISAADEP